MTMNPSEAAQETLMKNKKQWIIQLFILLFSVSVSIAVLPNGFIHTYGLFGEITSSTVASDEDSKISEEWQVFENRKQVKGVNVYNSWFEIWSCIIYLIFAAYILKLPRGDTIITLKVRMNN